MNACESEFLSLLSAARSEEDLLNELAASMLRLSQAHTCDVMLADSERRLVLRASTHVPEWNERLKLGEGIGISGQVFQQNLSIFIEKGAWSDPRFANYPGFDDRDSDGLAVIPMLHEGEAYGVVVFRKNVPWRFDEAEKQRLLGMVHSVDRALAAFRNAYRLGSQASRLGALTEVSRNIADSPYLDEILQLLVNLTAQQFNYHVCTVRLLDKSRQELILRATQSTARAYHRKRAIHFGESIAGRAISENRPIIVPDVRLSTDYIGHDLAEAQGLRSMISIPLVIQDRPIGVLTCYTKEVREFTEDEVNALQTLAQQAAFSIEHAKLQVRDTLMQEMHHRVKNSLQQVASLLRLQMRHSAYKSLEEALTDCLARILAIASVHDLLSREDLDHVDLRSIAEALIHHQKSSLLAPECQINALVEGDSVYLNMSQATQVALMINELLLNAVEHGFKEQASGDLSVSILDHEGEITMRVQNTGLSLPKDFEISKSSHLGLHIVENFIRSMGGTFRLYSEGQYTCAEAIFRRSEME